VQNLPAAILSPPLLSLRLLTSLYPYTTTAHSNRFLSQRVSGRFVPRRSSLPAASNDGPSAPSSASPRPAAASTGGAPSDPHKPLPNNDHSPSITHNGKKDAAEGLGQAASPAAAAGAAAAGGEERGKDREPEALRSTYDEDAEYIYFRSNSRTAKRMASMFGGNGSAATNNIQGAGGLGVKGTEEAAAPRGTAAADAEEREKEEEEEEDEMYPSWSRPLATLIGNSVVALFALSLVYAGVKVRGRGLWLPAARGPPPPCGIVLFVFSSLLY
jgi:hypothetical protein